MGNGENYGRVCGVDMVRVYDILEVVLMKPGTMYNEDMQKKLRKEEKI